MDETSRARRSSRRPRLVLGLTGVVVSLGAFLGGGRPNLFVLVPLAVALASYLLYMTFVETRLLSVLGGVALLILPVLAYGDFYLDRYRGVSDGFNFGFVTVPAMNLGITAGIVLADQLLLRRRSGR